MASAMPATDAYGTELYRSDARACRGFIEPKNPPPLS
jgi:hypothetical protein